MMIAARGPLRRPAETAQPLAAIRRATCAHLAAKRLGLACILIAASPAVALAADALPQNGRVAAGSATISQPSGGSLSITQTSPRAVIDWNSFSVGPGNRVQFGQPSSASALLNRVTGAATSNIAGQITANGQVFFVNPNGFAITPSGSVKVGGGFVASTLGITNDDFMSGQLRFRGGDTPAGVINGGSITTGQGGFVGLIGGHVDNDGRIVAPLGKVGLGAGAEITLDLNGDGFMQIAVPRSTPRGDGKALVTSGGEITANGGSVELKAATVRSAVRDIVNVPGRISARSASGRNGSIVLGGGSRGRVSVSGSLEASRVGLSGGKVEVGGTVRAQRGDDGGTIIIKAGDVKLGRSSQLDASGRVGGWISILSEADALMSGRTTVSGDSRGGSIDISGRNVAVVGARLEARGGEQAGVVRIGGTFRGGERRDGDHADWHQYIGRHGNLSWLANADTTVVDASSTIDVSATSPGGSAGSVVVWSERETRMNASIVARDVTGHGAIEISSRGTIADLSLDGIALSRGGRLLLDPKDIVVQDGGADLAGDITYDGSSATTFISGVALSNLIVQNGISVTLEASNDISINSSLGSSSGGFAATYGDLTLRAGRSVYIYGDLLLRSSHGGHSNVTILANDPAAVGPRDPGQAEVTLLGRIDLGGTGHLSVTMAAGATPESGSGITLPEITAGSVSVLQNGTSDQAWIQLYGNVTTDRSQTYTGPLVIAPFAFTSHLDLTASAGIIDWTSEASSAITAGFEMPSTVAFWENGQLTRYGKLAMAFMPNADATRLSVGPGTGTFSRVYGDGNETITPALGPQLHVTRGSLRDGDTVASLVAPGMLAFDGPEVTAPAGLAHGSIRATNGATFAISSVNDGYFIDLTATVPVTITPRPLTYTVASPTYEYGSPSAIVGLTGFVNGDTALPEISAPTLGGTRTLVATADAGQFALVDRTSPGTHAYTVTGLFGTSSGNYTLVPSGATSATVTIDPRTLSYTCCNASMTYGDTPPTLSLSFGNVLLGDTVAATGSQISNAAGVATLDARTDAGEYRISATGLTGTAAANYRLPMVGAGNPTLTIDPRFITALQSGSLPLTYGDVAPTFTLDGVLSGDTVLTDWRDTATGGRYMPGLDVGTYTFGLLLNGADAGNYRLGVSTQTFTLGRRPITADFNGLSFVYGDGGAVTPALSGVLAGDDVTPIGGGTFGTSTVHVGLPSNTNVGSYGGQVIDLEGADAGNYRMTSTTGRLAVTPRPVTYSFLGGSYLYGDAALASANAGQPLLTGLLISDEPFLTPVIGFTDASGSSSAQSTRAPVGNYGTIVTGLVSTGAALASNYVLDAANSTPGTIRIEPRPIRVTMSDVTATYGDEPTIGALTSPLTGLVNGEVASISSGLYAADGTPVPTRSSLFGVGTAIVPRTTDVGTYTIRGTGFTGASNGFDPRNYVLEATNGTLTLTTRHLTYTIADATKVYGEPIPTLATLGGVVADDDVRPIVVDVRGDRFTERTGVNVLGWGMRVAGIEGSRAHNYAITPELFSSATLMITPRPIVVDSGSQTVTFGTAPLAFSPTLTGVLTGDAVSVDEIRVTSQSTGNRAVLDGFDTVGRYDVTATRLAGAASPNYTIASTSPTRTLTINPMPITVQLPDHSQEWGFDHALPVFGITPVGTVGLPIQLHSATSRNSPAGTYAITGLPTGANAVNFDVTLVPGTLTVTPLQVRSITSNASTVYGEAPTPSVRLESATSGRAITFIDTRLGSFDAAGQPIDTRLAADTYRLGYQLPSTSNYAQAIDSPGILTVTPRILFAPHSQPLQVVYGDSPERLTVDSTRLAGVLVGDVVQVSVEAIARPAGNAPDYANAINLRTRFESDGTIKVATRHPDGTPSSYVAPPDAGAYYVTSGAVVGPQSRNYTLAPDSALLITPRPITVTGGLVTTTYGEHMAVYSPRHLVDPGNIFAPGTYTFDNLALASHASRLVPNISTSIRSGAGAAGFSYETMPNVDAGTYATSVIPGTPITGTDIIVSGVSQPTVLATCSQSGSNCIGQNYVIASTGNADVTVAVLPRPVTFDIADRRVTYGTSTTLSAQLSNVLDRDRASLGVAFGISEDGTLRAVSGGLHVEGGTYSGALNRAPAGLYDISIAGLTGTASNNYRAVSAGSTPGILRVDRKLLTYTTSDAYGFVGYGTTVGNMSNFGSYVLNGLIDGDVVIPELALADRSTRFAPDDQGNLRRDANGNFIREEGWFSNFRTIGTVNLNDPSALAAGEYGIVVSSLKGPAGANYQIAVSDNRTGVLSWLKLDGFSGSAFGEPEIVRRPLPTSAAPAVEPAAPALAPPADSGPSEAGVSVGTSASAGAEASLGAASAEAEASAGAGVSVALGDAEISVNAEARAEAVAMLNLWSTTPIDLSATVSATVATEAVISGICGGTPCELAIGASVAAEASLSARLDLLTGAEVTAEAGLAAGVETRFQSQCGQATCVVSGGVTASVGASAGASANWENGLETDTEVGVSIGVDVTGEAGVSGDLGGVSAAGGISTGRVGAGQSMGGSFDDGTLHLDLGLSMHIGIVGVTFDLGIDLDVYAFADGAKDTVNAVGEFYKDVANDVGCGLGLGGCSSPWTNWVDFASPADELRVEAVQAVRTDLATYKMQQAEFMRDVARGIWPIEKVQFERQRLMRKYYDLTARVSEYGLTVKIDATGTTITDLNPPRLAKFRTDGSNVFVQKPSGWVYYGPHTKKPVVTRSSLQF